MTTIACRMALPGDVPKGTMFQTPDLEAWPDGGYEISPDGRLSLVAPFAWGERLPDTTQCGPISFTGVLRFRVAAGAGREGRGFTAEFKGRAGGVRGRRLTGLRRGWSAPGDSMTAIDSWLASLKVPEVAALVSAAAALVSLLFAFFVYWRMSQGKVIVTWRLREPGVPVIDVLVKNTGPNGERAGRLPRWRPQSPRWRRSSRSTRTHRRTASPQRIPVLVHGLSSLGNWPRSSAKRSPAWTQLTQSSSGFLSHSLRGMYSAPTEVRRMLTKRFPFRAAAQHALTMRRASRRIASLVQLVDGRLRLGRPAGQRGRPEPFGVPGGVVGGHQPRRPGRSRGPPHGVQVLPDHGRLRDPDV